MPLGLIPFLTLFKPTPGSMPFDVRYFGVYVGNKKLGNAEFKSEFITFRGHVVKKESIVSKIVTSEAEQTTTTLGYYDRDGHPVFSSVVTRSPAGSMRETQEFGGGELSISYSSNSERGRNWKVPIPEGVRIILDPVSDLAFGNYRSGETAILYQADTSTRGFLKQSLSYQGTTTIDVLGKKEQVDWARVHDSGRNRDIDLYFEPSGEIVKASYALSFDLILEDKSDYRAVIPKNNRLDVLRETRLNTLAGLEHPRAVKKLEVTVQGDQSGAIPSDQHQTATSTPDGWRILVHPIELDSVSEVTVPDLANQQLEWLKPEELLPCANPEFVNLAKKIVGNETSVVKAVAAIRRYVCEHVKYDLAVAGTTRNASEILKSRRGICVDFAVLTATLLRAAGIPTRLVSGMTEVEGGQNGLYGHAWIEFYAGGTWIDLETTDPTATVSGAYIELAHGNYEQAFDYPITGIREATFKLIQVTY